MISIEKSFDFTCQFLFNGLMQMMNGFSMALNVRSDVERGQRCKHNGVAWEVVELCSLNGIPHVRIVRVSDPNELKLISVSAFLERYDFALE